jgi:hypothetical protein
MDNIWDYILIFLLGWTVGVKFYMYRLEKDLKEYAKDNGIKIEEVDGKPSIVPTLTVDIQEGVLYLYDKKSNTFLCQGTSIDELANSLVQFNKIPKARVEYLNHTLLMDNGKVHYES